MTKKAQALLDKALKLSAPERAAVIAGLATSLEDANDDLKLSPEWRDEIERRVEGILSGRTRGIPIGRAIKTLRSSLETDRRGRGEAPSR